MAGTTGLEPATSAVTGQRSNQLSYVPRRFEQHALELILGPIGLQSLHRNDKLSLPEVRFPGASALFCSF
jgi:hypothetical protein